MRLGAYPCSLVKGSVAQRAYGALEINERHRHRYEFNNDYRETVTSKGMMLSGINREGDLVEIVEVPGHPWFLGCQFHPEFKSKPLNPHPLFRAFVAAALENKIIRG
jgi:CTP synthase